MVDAIKKRYAKTVAFVITDPVLGPNDEETVFEAGPCTSPRCDSTEALTAVVAVAPVIAITAVKAAKETNVRPCFGEFLFRVRYGRAMVPSSTCTSYSAVAPVTMRLK